MSDNEKSDRQLLLEIHGDMAGLKRDVAHHLDRTCLRHEETMRENRDAIRSLEESRSQAHGGWRAIVAAGTAGGAIVGLILKVIGK